MAKKYSRADKFKRGIYFFFNSLYASIATAWRGLLPSLLLGCIGLFTAGPLGGLVGLLTGFFFGAATWASETNMLSKQKPTEQDKLLLDYLSRQYNRLGGAKYNLTQLDDWSQPSLDSNGNPLADNKKQEVKRDGRDGYREMLAGLRRTIKKQNHNLPNPYEQIMQHLTTKLESKKDKVNTALAKFNNVSHSLLDEYQPLLERRTDNLSEDFARAKEQYDKLGFFSKHFSEKGKAFSEVERQYGKHCELTKLETVCRPITGISV